MSIGKFPESLSRAMLVGTMLVGRLGVHPVSITRFPLIIFSPGAGLLRNRLFIGSG